MKKTSPALSRAIALLFTLCLAITPTLGALSEANLPAPADVLLYKHLVGELKLFDFEITGDACTISTMERDGVSAQICTWKPTEKIEYEIEYWGDTPVRYTLRIDTGSAKKMQEESLFALAAFTMTFVDYRQEKASEVIDQLVKNKKAEDGYTRSELDVDGMKILLILMGPYTDMTVFPT